MMKQCYSCVCVAALALVYTAVALCPANEECVTELGNIARYRNITTNSTCGRDFCEESLCTDCSNTTSYHGIDNINDGRNDTWWESDRGAMNIIIQIDLEAPMIFDSTLILWQSSRPMSMVIERSSDFGQTWIPYRFFSSQCSTTFGVPEYLRFLQGMPPNTTEAICLAEEANIMPKTNGEIIFSINDQVAPGFLSSQQLLEYQTVTNLRLRLVEPFTTLGEDYFAIYEWFITGTCLCNGHGMCSPVTGNTVKGKIHAGCDCVHNTDGSHCEVCQPLYNNAPWMPASGSEVNACQMCNCNMHASSCVYDEVQGQGVCNCQDNTDGPMCETCQPGYYVDQTVLQTNPNVCIPCGCDPRGTVGGVDNCDVTSGQCSCKTNVVNSFCSSCAVGFYNLTETNPDGCQACDCESRGSQGCDETGVCMCKDNVIPPDCSQCMDGFTGLSSVTASCEPCNCNPPGSTTLVCDKDLGTCSCIPNVVNLLCDIPAGGYYVKALDNVKFEAEMANFVNGTTVVYPLSNTGLLYTGRGFARIGSGEGVQFTLSVEMSSTYEVTVRYWTTDPTASVTLMIESQVPVDMTLDCSSLDPSSSTSGTFLSSLPTSPDGTTSSYHVLIPAICLEAGVQYTASLTYDGSGEILVDSFVLIPNFNLTSQIYDSLDVTLRGECIPRMLTSTIPIVCNDITFTLSVEFYGQVFPCDCDEIGSLVMDPQCRKYGGSCYCKTGVTGERCDRCLNGYYNLTQAGCSECGCDTTGSTSQICDQSSGQCTCKPGVVGRTCNRCEVGYSNFSAGGCTECLCSSQATTPQCDNNGVCNCISTVNGDKCDSCESGFYNLTLMGCSPCGCNLSGSGSMDCDQSSGQCQCVGGAIGRDCSLCPANSSRTSGIFTPVCQFCMCSGKSTTCNVDETNFAVGSTQHDFVDLCSRLGECQEGWRFYDPETNITGSIFSSGSRGLLYFADSDSNRLYAPSSYLGEHLLSYGLNFTAQISVSGITTTAPIYLHLRGSRFEQPIVTAMSVSPMPDDVYVLMAQLQEGPWRVATPQGPVATYIDIFTVLADLTELSFTAKLNEGFGVHGAYLQFAQLQQAVPVDSTSINDTTYPVEICSCPRNYTGQFCHLCSSGYFRLTGNLGDMCVSCDCNGLATTCDVDTGVCVNCTGNSTGDHCELCIPGFFGDPARGIPCQPCPCPLVGRSFSSTCFLDLSDGLPTCDACQQGYTGRNCDVCQDGYFGNPTIGICNMCDCNGNVDPALGPVCNTTSGECMNCLNNTTGPTCNECLENHFGNPLIGDCKPCECHVNGTRICDLISGACLCRANVMGSTCDTCEPNHWGIHLGVQEGCLPCSCCANGSSDSQCNQLTGRCSCLSNIGSLSDDKCCQCTPGYFGLTSSGCQACGCSNGSVSEECDQVTGDCQCIEGATGSKCDGCGPDYEGRVPHCTRCHECYFTLNTTIHNLLSQTEGISERVANLSVVYGNETLADVQEALMMLHSQLASTISILSSLVVTEEDLTTVNISLAQVQSAMMSLSDRVSSISSFVYQTSSRLNASYSVDFESMRQTSVNYLNRANNLNATANANRLRAYDAFQTIQGLHTSALESWQNATLAESQVTEAVISVQMAVQESMQVESDLEAFMSKYDSNRMDLSSVQMTLNMTAGLIDSAILNLLSENATLQETYNSVMNLTEIYLSRYLHVINLMAAVDDLENLVQMTTDEANRALQTAQELISTSESLVNSLRDRHTEVSNLSSIVANASSEAINARSTARSVLQLPVPTTDEALNLSQRINQSAVDEETVSAIFSRAEESKNTSESVLNLAQNASSYAERASNMVNLIAENLNNVTDLHKKVNVSFSTVQQDIMALQNNVDAVTSAVDTIDDTHNQAVTARTNATRLAQIAENQTNASLAFSRELVTNATQLCDQVQQFQQEVISSGGTIQNVSTEVTRRLGEAGEQLIEAQGTRNRANALNVTTKSVSLERLQELLNEYISERNRQTVLAQRLQDLNREMDTLEQDIITASSNLASCYSTP